MPTKFEQALRAQGSYFDPTQVADPSRTFLTSMLAVIDGDIQLIKESAAQRGFELPTPSLAFISDFELNAFADKFEDEYCIGINIGAIYVLNDVFNKIFSSQTAFPNYGDPTREQGILADVNPHIKDASVLFRNPAHQGQVPADPERANAAALLTVLAARFLALHEYGHIVNGHVDYKYSVARGFRFEEAPQPEAPNIFSPFDSQTLEMDADGFATQRGLSLALAANQYDGEIFRLLARDKTEAVNLWGTAAHVLFRLFADVRLESDTLTENSYPTFGARILAHKMLIAETLIRHNDPSVKQELGIEGESIEAVLRMGMHHFHWVETAFREMHATEFAQHAVKLYAEQASEPEQQVFEARGRHWAGLRSKLLPFAKSSLAPAQA